MARVSSSNNRDTSVNIGFEAKLWLASDKLRSNMDAAELQARCPWPHLSEVRHPIAS